jgi:hypothetical protein
MSDYLVTYEGGNMTWTKRSPEEIQAAMEEWGPGSSSWRRRACCATRARRSRPAAP